MTVGDVNVGEQLTEVVQNTEETLQGITDAASAEAAVPELNAINTRIEELSGTVDQLPPDAKKVLADVLGKRVTELKTLADKLAGQQGVGDVVKPALEPIIAKLEDWAQAPASASSTHPVAPAGAMGPAQGATWRLAGWRRAFPCGRFRADPT